MGSDGDPPRSPARLPHTDGPVTAKIDGQFWHGQLTSPLPFLTMASTVSQVWYTHPGLLHEGRPTFRRSARPKRNSSQPPDLRNRKFLLRSMMSYSYAHEFIPIKSLAAKVSGGRGSYAGHSRFPSRHPGHPASTGGSDL